MPKLLSRAFVLMSAVIFSSVSFAHDPATAFTNDEQIALNRFTREAFSETMRSDNIFGEYRNEEIRYLGKPGEPLLAMRTFYFKARDRRSICHAGIRIDRTTMHDPGDHIATVGFKCVEKNTITRDTAVTYLIQAQGGKLQNATLVPTPLSSVNNVTPDP